MRTRAEFYALLSALLFVAACAWLGAALFGPQEEEAETPAAAAAIRLRGTVLRRELKLAEVPAGASDGKRLSAEETGLVSGLYVAAGDGFALSPEDARPFSEARAEALLETSGAEDTGPRLVTGNAVWIAALLDSGALPKGSRCRVRLEGLDRPIEALVEEADGSAILLRTTEGLEYLCRVRFVEGEILD